MAKALNFTLFTLHKFGLFWTKTFGATRIQSNALLSGSVSGSGKGNRSGSVYGAGIEVDPERESKRIRPNVVNPDQDPRR